MIRACIFDLDGVIVDTAHYHFLAWKRLGEELGISLTEQDNERLKGVSRMQSLDIILEIGGITRSVHEKEALANKKNAWFVDFIERMSPDEIFPDIKSLIRSLKSRSIAIGLASSSKNARTVIDLLHIKELFDTVVDGTMITHTKPDPEIFLLAAGRLGIEPADCLVFEDAASGVQAARAAGMRVVGIGTEEQLSNADLVLRRTGDFKPEMLEELYDKKMS